jgi:hypothetical protein
MSNTATLSQLERKVQNAIDRLTPKELHNIDLVDIGGFTPSLPFSIGPMSFEAVQDQEESDDASGERNDPMHDGVAMDVDGSSLTWNYFDYQIAFPSNTVLKWSKKSIIRKIAAKRADFVQIFSGCSRGRSLAGSIFEDICHDFFTFQTSGSFAMKKIPMEGDVTEGVVHVEFKETGGVLTGPVEGQTTFHLTVGPSVEAEPLEIVEKAKQGLYAIPTITNAADYDSLCKNVAFQMTVSTKHPFNKQRVMDLATELLGKKKPTLLDPKFAFIYMVPEATFHDFTYQWPLTAAKKQVAESSAKKCDEVVEQYVMGVTSEQIANWYSKPRAK